MVRINLKNGYQNKYVNIYSDKKILLIVFCEKRKKYMHTSKCFCWDYFEL